VVHNERAFLPDPVYDAYWDERDYLTRIAKVKASVLLVGSWQDTNVHPINSFEMWRALPAGVPKKLIMGPNGHSDAQVKDNQDLYHAWFDHWLLGLDTGIMRLPRSDSVVNHNERFQDSAWPPVGTRTVALSLGRGGSQRGTLGLVDNEVPRWTDNNPTLDESTALGSDAQDARILFTGAPVDKDVRISGVPVLEVSLTTSAESTHLTPVLYDQSSAGTRTVVTRGLLNSRNRSSLRESTPITPGSTWRAEVRFQPVDYVLPEGHRLGIAMMSMNAAEALYPDTTGATNELRLDRTARLLVPAARNAAALGDELRPVVRPRPVGAVQKPAGARSGGALAATGPAPGVAPLALLMLLLAGIARRRLRTPS
jgi:X-Pro dipeptidyl-peptidase